MEHTPGWDPFLPLNPMSLVPMTPSSLVVCVSEEQAVCWRVREGLGDMVELQGRHWTGQLTCATMARQLATIFLGTASGNILAFPARIEREQQQHILNK